MFCSAISRRCLRELSRNPEIGRYKILVLNICRWPCERRTYLCSPEEDLLLLPLRRGWEELRLHDTGNIVGLKTICSVLLRKALKTQRPKYSAYSADPREPNSGYLPLPDFLASFWPRHLVCGGVHKWKDLGLTDQAQHRPALCSIIRAAMCAMGGGDLLDVRKALKTQRPKYSAYSADPREPNSGYLPLPDFPRTRCEPRLLLATPSRLRRSTQMEGSGAQSSQDGQWRKEAQHRPALCSIIRAAMCAMGGDYLQGRADSSDLLDVEPTPENEEAGIFRDC